MRFLLLALACLMLSACAPRTKVRVDPVNDTRSRTPAATRPVATPVREYVVARGDTLYGIAFRHGMDYRQLAQLNRINPPFTIYPGQRLQLGASPPATATAASSSSRPPTGVGAGVVAPIATGPRETGPGTTSTSTVNPISSGTPAMTTPLPPAASPPAMVSSGPVRWRWPAEGPLAANFVANDPTRQGLNIAGTAGQPIFAAADGVVVYSGSGLIGYGELIIVKHSEEWLSAYGHNRKRLAEEGSAVKGGQQIAEMGRSGASRDMLHFEIRRNGKPVDPISLLPRR